MFLNGLDCWKKNVAESVSDKVQQICGLVVRAEKCLLAGHLGKLPGSQGQCRSHPRVTWHLPSQSLIQPNLRQGILCLSLNHVQTALFLFGRVYYLRECVSTCLKIFFPLHIVTNLLFIQYLLYTLLLNPYNILQGRKNLLPHFTYEETVYLWSVVVILYREICIHTHAYIYMCVCM